MNFPEINSIVLEYLFQLRAAGGHHDVGRAARGKSLAIDVGVVEKIHAVNHDALLGSGQAAKHFVAIGDAIVLLDDCVACAGGHVIAIGPNGGPRIIGEQGAFESVAIIFAQRIAGGAHGVAHGVCGMLFGWICWRSAGRPGNRSAP